MGEKLPGNRTLPGIKKPFKPEKNLIVPCQRSDLSFEFLSRLLGGIVIGLGPGIKNRAVSLFNDRKRDIHVVNQHIRRYILIKLPANRINGARGSEHGADLTFLAAQKFLIAPISPH